jgi:hypothetical protein
MTHESFEGLIELSLVGGLSDEELAAFEAHRVGCDACRRSLEQAESFDRAVVAALEPYRAPAGLDGRIALAVGTAHARRRPIRFPGWLVKSFTAAGIAAAAGALIFTGAVMTEGRAGKAHGLIRQIEAASEQSEFRHASSFSDDIRAKLLASSGTDAAVDALGRTAKTLTYWGDNDYVADFEAASVGRTYAYPVNDVVIGKADFPSIETEANTLIAAGSDLRIDGAFSEKLGARYQPDVATPRETEKKLEELNKNLGREEARKSDRPADAKAVGGVAGARPAPTAAPKPPEPRQQAPDDRKIIRNGSLTLEVDSFDATQKQVEQAAQELGGYVGDVNREKLANGKIHGTITVRVPADKFDAAVERLRALGDLKNQNVTASDVTKAYFDLQGRLANAVKLQERLRELIKKEGAAVKDLLEVEKELGRVSGQIEQMTGELKFYDNQVSFSMLTLTIAEKDIALPAEYVETQAAVVRVVAKDIDAAFDGALKVVTGAAGQLLESKLNRQEGGADTAVVKARIVADKFEASIQDLKKLGVVLVATVDRRQSTTGDLLPGQNAKLRKEAGVVELTIEAPQEKIRAMARLRIETPSVKQAYEAARKLFGPGRLDRAHHTENVERPQVEVAGRVSLAEFDKALATIGGLGEVKEKSVERSDVGFVTPSGEPIPIREMGGVSLTIAAPPKLVSEEKGIGATLRRTLGDSASALSWSIEKLVVGASYVLVWGAVLAAVVFGIRRWRKARAKPAGA